jgi:integrase
LRVLRLEGRNRVEIGRELARAVAGAQISPLTFHELRHTFASQLIQNGVSLLYVAAALGHRDSRMVEKHYGHLAPSHFAETIRANVPTLEGPTPQHPKLTSLRTNRAAG